MHEPGGFDQPSMTIRGTLQQAARDIVNAVPRPEWNFDTSLTVHFMDIAARLLLAAFAAYRLGYRRGVSAGIKLQDRRDPDP